MYIYASIGGDTKVVESFEVRSNPINEDEAEYYILVDAIHEDWIQRKRWNAESQIWEDVLPSEASYHNSLEFTHIDSNGTKHWLDVYVNGLTSHSNVAVTQNTTNTLANTESTDYWGAQVKHYPHLEMCFTRVFCTAATTLEADTAYAVGVLADTSCTPEYTMPLTISCGKEVQAYIGNTGTIYIKPYETVYSNTPIRIAGFWFRPNVVSE